MTSDIVIANLYSTRRASLNSKNGMMLLSLLADEGVSRRINIVNNITYIYSMIKNQQNTKRRAL